MKVPSHLSRPRHRRSLVGSGAPGVPALYLTWTQFTVPVAPALRPLLCSPLAPAFRPPPDAPSITRRYAASRMNAVLGPIAKADPVDGCARSDPRAAVPALTSHPSRNRALCETHWSGLIDPSHNLADPLFQGRINPVESRTESLLNGEPAHRMPALAHRSPNSCPHTAPRHRTAVPSV